MPVPSRRAAAALLLSLEPPAWQLRHARAVAEIAGWLAPRCAARGAAVDRALVEAAALLHDIDKAIPATGPAADREANPAVAPAAHPAALAHGAGSAAWLAARGMAELAPAVAAHPVTRLLEPGADTWLTSAPIEELLVSYADKRAGQRLESLEARFAGWRRRYPGGWSAADEALARARAAALEAAVCGHAGVAPGAVRRLAWTGPALRAARIGAAERAA
ncbi:MAG TPA: HD domain-containing protein [Patescibacteria group bacterium]|nr:HD domain-containing protein [Patescibacteria group bacterium]